eukprot:m.336479 g.336479  ORF g.336479 m.336479 type:complete len:957 (+) comp55698_c0_seq1:23-2893(+)
MGDEGPAIQAVKPGMTDNLTELENLDERTLMVELQTRYLRDCIYTYVGEILVAVNPFKRIEGIYDQNQMRRYTNIGDRASQPPHVFAAADAAFSAMVQNPPGVKANQVCVISGESGAGKTESAKLFIKQIISLSGSGTSGGSGGLEEKIVALNPLMESYGNAQTLRNDNSSRFGKFIELRFNEQIQIEGAYQYEYLLEKSRVISQAEGERNFHVFYLFFAGLKPDEKAKYQCDDPATYRYIKGNKIAIAEITQPRYIGMAEELQQCISSVGFTDEEKEQLNCLLSGILHCGDITFGGDESAKMDNPSNKLAKMCQQLGLDKEQMEAAMTTTTSVTRGENIVRNYKPFEAGDVRDAIAKALYGRTFTWIVAKINVLLGPKTKQLGPRDKKIGILDIFGFESFQINSFEQLLINLANEQLQYFFNNHIFKMELDEMAREGIDGTQIKYEDNQALLDMLLSKTPPGILAVIDEEALFPKGTDKTMCEKLNTGFGNKPNYPKFERPKGNEEIFSIVHYAGRVTYTGANFLEKNRDSISLDVICAFQCSTKPLVEDIWDESSAEDKAKAKKKARPGKGTVRKNLDKAISKGKKVTVGAQFKNSLAELMSEMSVAQPHFIRTIKPNEQKVPNKFDEELVTKQLRYCGMLETTRIRKEGYAYRPTFQDFILRYKVLAFKFTSNPPPNDGSCRKICEKSGISGYQVGKTKVFLRYFHVDELNIKLKPYPDAAARIQRLCRGFVGRNKYDKVKAEAEKFRKLFIPFVMRVEKVELDFGPIFKKIDTIDSERPKDFWHAQKQMETNKEIKKIMKKVPKGSAAAMQRAASVRWYKDIEMKKGAGVEKGAGFHEWFHGVITRKATDSLLSDKEPGTFLVRVSESRFGYSLSHVVAPGKVKHYMVDQTPEGLYTVVGNPKTFPSLNALVQYHSQHKIVTTDNVVLMFACGQEQGIDDRDEFGLKIKKKK